MCKALCQVHNFGIIHRDIKAANIFLDNSDQMKLADFGISRVLSNSRSKAYSQVGSPAYMAPEIVQGKEYSMEVDIWALGVITFELYTGRRPWKAKDQIGIYDAIISGNFANQPAIKLLKIKVDKKKLTNSQEIESRGFFIGLPTKKLNYKVVNKLSRLLLNISNI